MASVKPFIREEKKFTSAKIYLQTISYSKVWKLSINIAIDKKHWDQKNNCVAKGEGNSTYINKIIDEKVKEIKDIVYKLQVNNVPPTIERIKKEFSHSANSITTPTNFFDYIDSLIKLKLKQGVNNASLGVYRNVKKHLKVHSPVLYVTDIDYNFLHRFEAYLCGKGIATTTSHKYLKTLKLFCKSAYYDKLTTENAFENYKLKKGKSHRKHLTVDEIKKIMYCSLANDHDHRVRELFLFQCVTGIEYKSLFALRWENIYADRIEYIRAKTGQLITIPFLDLSKKYIDRFMRTGSKDHVFRTISNQKYNKYLKNIQKAAELTKTLTSHVGRHTFATMALNYGIPIEVVSSILGHTSIATTQIYAEILGATKHIQMQRINNELSTALQLA